MRAANITYRVIAIRAGEDLQLVVHHVSGAIIVFHSAMMWDHRHYRDTRLTGRRAASGTGRGLRPATTCSGAALQR
ncbi:hypothetical protein KCP69_22730 [Salmonella enterica subsp. enterica]|nr:hypothetical protein KCP69_22730 [Salmonella enterica subsp. enterica]